jgi:hypothetical protein
MTLRISVNKTYVVITATQQQPSDINSRAWISKQEASENEKMANNMEDQQRERVSEVA